MTHKLVPEVRPPRPDATAAAVLIVGIVLGNFLVVATLLELAKGLLP